MPTGVITPANAREMQRKSVEARLAAKYREPEKPQATDSKPQFADDWQTRRLNRVREAIDRLDGELARARDPEVIDQLSRALKALSEQERILDGRPLPGSLRPKAQRRGSDELLPVPMDEHSEPPFSVPYPVT